MSTTPWRGTLIFAGGIAAVAATAVARFGGVDALTGAVGAPAGTGSSAATSTGQTAGTARTATGTTNGKASSSDASATGTSGGQGSSSGSAASTSPTATPSTAPASGGAVTIVGSTVMTRYGPVQVSVTFDGSTISGVQALQSPSWHGESVQINAYAIPVLNQEAVAAGSAQIDSVSGATFTSEAYKQSLQAAIDQHA